MKRISEKLTKFLAENDSLDQFKSNIKNMGSAKTIKDFHDISSSFIWEASPQGHYYWQKLDEKFNKIP